MRDRDAAAVEPSPPAGEGGLRELLAFPASLLRFSAEAVFELRGVWRFSAEVLRQTGILIIGTTMLVVVLNTIFGSVCGIFGIYSLRPVGASDGVGVFTAFCTRSVVVVMAGYVLAAKVGCGLVAEIGSMKISEELDAYRSVGLDPMRFVVATRLAAMLLYLPFMYPIAQVSQDLGAFLSVVVATQEVSQGVWEAGHWALRNPLDLLYAFVQVVAVGVTVVLVASYYGYTVRGGPPEVGAATARSMVLNLVLTHAILAVGTIVFYGSNLNIPFDG